VRFNRKQWARVSFKVGTGPHVLYFVRRSDVSRLVIGQHLQIRRDDGTTNPNFQHDEGVLIDEVRSIGGGLLYVAERL
jgi:hypothetical protein